MARALRYPQFKALPDRYCGTEFLYALQACDGRIKVGRSGFPRNRLSTHAKELEREGLTVARFVVCPTEREGWNNEEELLRRLYRFSPPMPGRREWFTGLSWGQTTTLLRQISPRLIVKH